MCALWFDPVGRGLCDLGGRDARDSNLSALLRLQRVTVRDATRVVFLQRLADDLLFERHHSASQGGLLQLGQTRAAFASRV